MSRKSSALTGLLPVAYIALGLILILWPSMSSGIFCRLVGIGALAYGLLHLLNFWRFARGRGELAAGILLAALGVFCLVSPRAILSILPFFLGALLLLDGAVKLPRAFEMRALGFSRWWVELLFAALTAVLGLVLVLNPFGLVRLSVIFFGVSLLISGVSDLVIAAWMGRYR